MCLSVSQVTSLPLARHRVRLWGDWRPLRAWDPNQHPGQTKQLPLSLAEVLPVLFHLGV